MTQKRTGTPQNWLDTTTRRADATSEAFITGEMAERSKALC